MKCDTQGCQQGHGAGAVRHWLVLRITSVVAIPLCLWLVYSIIHLIGADYREFQGWVSAPVNGLAMALFIAISFLHAALGCQEIIEDYVHKPCVKKASLLLLNIACMLGALAGVLSILKIIFTI